jgi:diaminopimelate decarboxylase
MTAGAYGAVQAGTYNTRRWCRKCLFGKRNGRWCGRVLEVADLIALDRLPPWL